MWKDETSYSRSSSQEIRTVVFRAGAIKVTVHRHIDHGPDVWLLSCEPFFTQHKLRSKDLDTAKNEALDKVQNAMKSVVLALNQYLDKTVGEGKP